MYKTILLFISLSASHTLGEWVEISQQHYLKKPGLHFDPGKKVLEVNAKKDGNNYGGKGNSDSEVTSGVIKGNVFKITNVGVVQKVDKDHVVKDSDVLEFVNHDKEEDRRKPLSNIVKRPHYKEQHQNIRKPGYSSINKGNSAEEASKIKTSSHNPVKNSNPIEENLNSGQRYESYELGDENTNRKTANKNKSNVKHINKPNRDHINIQNLDDVIAKPTNDATTEIIYLDLTTENPYKDVIYDIADIPYHRIDIKNADKEGFVEADKISDVKLVIKPKLPNQNKDFNHDLTNNNDGSFKNTVANRKGVFSPDKEEIKPSNVIKNDKIPFERLDVTKIIDLPDSSFVTKQEIIEEGFMIDEKPSVNAESDPDGVSVSIEDSETNTDEASTQNPNETKGDDVKTSHLNHTKPNPMENVIKVMKFVADTITKNTKKGFKSKINYLNRLKNTIMSNIVSRVEALWPDDEGPAAGSRSSRKARSHVEFPSSEGALMSISFLTFAVFLIKLVMQLIQTFRTNSTLFPAVVTVGRSAAAALNSRNGRGTN